MSYVTHEELRRVLEANDAAAQRNIDFLLAYTVPNAPARYACAIDAKNVTAAALAALAPPAAEPPAGEPPMGGFVCGKHQMVGNGRCPECFPPTAEQTNYGIAGREPIHGIPLGLSAAPAGEPPPLEWNALLTADDVWKSRAEWIAHAREQRTRADKWEEKARQYAQNADYWRERAERAEADAEKFRELWDIASEHRRQCAEHAKKAEAERDALRAERDAAAKQEPVEWQKTSVNPWGADQGGVYHYVSLHSKIYAAPVPAADAAQAEQRGRAAAFAEVVAECERRAKEAAYGPYGRCALGDIERWARGRAGR